MAPQTIDLLFTIAASLSLLVLFVTAALVLPWTDDELELIDLWHDQHQNRYEYYLKMGW